MEWFQKDITKRQLIKGGEIWEFKTDVLSTCGTGRKADFWITATYLSLNTTLAKIIYIDLEVELTQCKNPESGKNEDPYVSCYANYFEAYAYFGPNTFSKYSVQNKMKSTEILDIYSPLYNITNNTAVGAKLTKSNQTFFFYRNNSQGVVLAMRSPGACGRIFRIKMYYYYCEEEFINGIKFEKASSPAVGTEAVVKGNCAGNTILPNNGTRLYGNCTYNGTWNVHDNVTCECVKNYELDRGIGICLPLLVSNKNPNFTHIAYGVNITWTALSIANDESILSLYYVRCFICISNASVCNISCTNEIYSPRQENLIETWVTVFNLTAGARYVFMVYVKYHLNGKISEGQWKYVETNTVVVRSETTTLSKPTTQNSSITAKPTGQTDKPTKDGFSLIMYIIIGAAAALLLILAILIIICMRRRYRNNVQYSTAFKTVLLLIKRVLDVTNIGFL